jgi:hypothetical protein
MAFDPPLALTVAFTALTLVVVFIEVWLVRRAAPPDRRRRWSLIAAAVAAGWLALHGAIAASGVLEGDRMPPPILFYLAPTMLVGVAVALSPIGRRLAALPLGLLVGLQAFRLPLEMILHGLYQSGDLPVQMTWSGLNFDVVTGLTAAVLGLVALRRPLPGAIVWAWNLLGAALLIVVVAIAITSAPTPLRQFTEGPPVVLVFHVPFTWIAGVHVWTALVGHLVIFRALAGRRRGAAACHAGA